MADMQRTLAIVKPDAVAAGATGEILRRIEEKSLRIVGLKRLQLSEQLARGFLERFVRGGDEPVRDPAREVLDGIAGRQTVEVE